MFLHEADRQNASLFPVVVFRASVLAIKQVEFWIWRHIQSSIDQLFNVSFIPFTLSWAILVETNILLRSEHSELKFAQSSFRRTCSRDFHPLETSQPDLNIGESVTHFLFFPHFGESHCKLEKIWRTCLSVVRWGVEDKSDAAISPFLSKIIKGRQIKGPHQLNQLLSTVQISSQQTHWSKPHTVLK